MRVVYVQHARYEQGQCGRDEYVHWTDVREHQYDGHGLRVSELSTLDPRPLKWVTTQKPGYPGSMVEHEGGQWNVATKENEVYLERVSEDSERLFDDSLAPEEARQLARLLTKHADGISESAKSAKDDDSDEDEIRQLRRARRLRRGG